MEHFVHLKVSLHLLAVWDKLTFNVISNPVFVAGVFTENPEMSSLDHSLSFLLLLVLLDSSRGRS